MTFRGSGSLLLLALLLAGAPGCGSEGVQRGTGRGQVVAVDTAAAEITLDHGEIPGVMGAMKMRFPVANPKLLEGVEAGETVDFDVEYRGGLYTVHAIRPAGG
jgi:Cu/Ag efflux protein CusF